MKFAVTLSCLFCLTVISPVISSEGSAGSWAAFTRGGFCGTKYIAMGNSGEALADDVFAIYWNPAGLSSIKPLDILSDDEIRTKADKGDISGISEEDLRRLNEPKNQGVFQIGMSASSISLDRQAAFGGITYSSSSGTFGAGIYSISSNKIDEYDTAGTKTGSSNYIGAEGFLSYGKSLGVSSFGFSVKGLQEKISDVTFAGGAADIGVQATPIPFLKVGVVAQDLGAGLYPVSGKNLEKIYHFASPTLRTSALLESRSAGVSVTAGLIRHMEQDDFIFTAGLLYSPTRNIHLSIGYCDSNFSTGVGLSIWKAEFWYAFSYDNIGMGYNHSVSLTAVL